MPIDEAVTQWIEQLREGDADAAEKLWQRYFPQLVQLARRKLEGAGRALSDEEDIALSAFKSFCFGARDGHFPKLTDRDSLWSLLVAITVHKSTDLIRHQNRQKRGGQGVKTPELDGSLRTSDIERLSEIIDKYPTAEFAAQISEQFELLLSKLDCADDLDLIEIALAKMRGDSTADIAQQICCVPRTVERKLLLIRKIWDEHCN